MVLGDPGFSSFSFSPSLLFCLGFLFLYFAFGFPRKWRQRKKQKIGKVGRE